MPVDATRVATPTTLVAVREDQLVPIGDMRALAARLPRARLHEMSSLHGHDAFLKDAAALQPVFASFVRRCDLSERSSRCNHARGARRSGER